MSKEKHNIHDDVYYGTNNREEKGKVGDPSPEAISHAKRMIALKWTKETNIDTIAGTWQAGYVAAQLDAQKPSSPPDPPDVQKAAEGVEQAARSYATHIVKGAKPWPQFDQVKYKAFIAGTQWSQGNQSEGWISVEDRLPGEGKRVFIYYKNDCGKYWRDIAIYTGGGKIEFDDENETWPECFNEKAGCSFLPKGFWFTDGDEEKTYPRTNVTHWQPLPPPPKTKQ